MIKNQIPMPDPKWADKGNCVGSRVKFHPVETDNRRHWDWKAKQICKNCPVKEPCLQHALQYHEVGVWGGTNESERRRIRKNPPGIAHP